MAEQAADPAPSKAGFNILLRFLPLLWPRGEAELKVRVVVALTLVLAGKAIALLMPFAYKAVVDGMSANRQAFGAVLMLVVAYAAARFGNVLADNLRNAVFEKVGQQAGRRLAATVFRHGPIRRRSYARRHQCDRRRQIAGLLPVGQPLDPGLGGGAVGGWRRARRAAQMRRGRRLQPGPGRSSSLNRRAYSANRHIQACVSRGTVEVQPR